MKIPHGILLLAEANRNSTASTWPEDPNKGIRGVYSSRLVCQFYSENTLLNIITWQRYFARSDWFLSGLYFSHQGFLLMTYTRAEPDVRSKEFPFAR